MPVVLYILAAVAILLLAICLICFRMAFYVSKKDRTPKEEYPIPEGKI